MRRLLSKLLLLYILIGILMQAVAAAEWAGWIRLGEEVHVGNYTITVDINKANNLTYAIFERGDEFVGLYMIDYNAVTVENVSIIAIRKNIANKSVKLYLKFPDNWTLVIGNKTIWPPQPIQPTNQTPVIENQTNQTAIANQTNQTVILPVNQTYECHSVEECQAIIEILQKQLEKERAERAQLEQRIRELEQQLQYLQQQQNITMMEKKQLEEQIKILRKALEEKNRKIMELEMEIERLKKEQLTWEGLKNKTEDWYLGWIAPWGMPIVSLGLAYAIAKWRPKAIKAKQYAIEEATKKVLEEMRAKKILDDMMKVRIDPLVDDKGLLAIIKSIVPQITGSYEVTRQDILNLDIEKFLKLAQERYLLKEDRLEYLRESILKLQERIRESLGGGEA